MLPKFNLNNFGKKSALIATNVLILASYTTVPAKVVIDSYKRAEHSNQDEINKSFCLSILEAALAGLTPFCSLKLQDEFSYAFLNKMRLYSDKQVTKDFLHVGVTLYTTMAIASHFYGLLDAIGQESLLEKITDDAL